MNKYLIILTSLFALAACGGGGGESGSNVSNTTASSTSSQQTGNTSNSDDSSQTESDNTDGNSEDSTSSDVGSEVIMTDLIIDKSFDLKTDVSLLIDAKISTGNVRAYLNVCQSKADSGKADYQNCILRKPISQGELNQKVILSRQDIDLVAEIWLYDNNPEPLRYQWQYDETLSEQKFEIRY